MKPLEREEARSVREETSVPYQRDVAIMSTSANTLRRLLIREERFVRALLSVAQGNQGAAARMAGYRHPQRAANRLMRRERVLAAIESELQQVVPKPDGPTKEHLVDKLWALVMDEDQNPFACARAGEVVARLMGWFAPTHRVNESVENPEGGSFQALVETLRQSGASFTPEQKKALLEELLVESSALQEALALLGNGTSH